MRLVFYIFIFAQFSNFLSVFAEKIKNDSSKFNSIKWEKIRENEVKPLKKIIWKSYQEDESYFKNKNSEKNTEENTEENTDNYFFNNQKEKNIFINEQKTTKELLIYNLFGAIVSCGFPLRKLICQMRANKWVYTVLGLTIN